MLTTIVFIGGTILLAIVYMVRHIQRERAASVLLKENLQAGVNEPPSLHPVIDEAACIGCGGCVDACPEMPLHSPLGLVNGKAVLVDAAHCIGHGACKVACPTNAIELVFGTEKRGVDIPIVKPSFETNAPNIFIAGELGGMGLIANAIDQGRSALESIKKVSGIGKGDRLDVLIVGAGPAGFSASLTAMQHKLRYRTIEQGDLGGTVYNFPRGKIVMTRAVNLSLVGKVKITETTKEKLLEFWTKVQKDTGVKINYRERLEAITRTDEGFVVKTTVGAYKTLTVLLCLGRGGTPRKLGVPGDDLPKVTYRLIDPAEFAGKRVLIVGGGDSALEAAHALADEQGTVVTLSYREKAFTRAKEKNRKKVEQAASEGRITILYESKVAEVEPDSVRIDQAQKMISLPNDGIICCLGGILPTPFLKEIGIEVETKRGETTRTMTSTADVVQKSVAPAAERKAPASAEAKPERAERQEGASAEAKPERTERQEGAVTIAEARPAEGQPAAAPRPATLPAAKQAPAEAPKADAAPRPAVLPTARSAATAAPRPAAVPKPAALPRAPIEQADAAASEEEKLDRMAAEAAELARRLASG